MDLLTSTVDGIKSDRLGYVKGYLVRFGDTKTADLEGDYFTPQTDYGFPVAKGQRVPLNVYYHHGMDSAVGKKSIGTGYIKMDDIGLWYEAQLDMADEYGNMIAKLCKQGKMGFSSGAAGHLVERKSMGVAAEITRWPIAEASITPTPAEYRNSVKTLKDMYAMDSMMDMDIEEEEGGEEYAITPEQAEPQIGEDPRAYIDKVYTGTGAHIIHEGFEGLYESLCAGIMGLYEVQGDKTPYIIALVDGFADRAKKLASAIGSDPMLVKSAPDSLRGVERRLRDAVGLTRSNAKRLAPVVWDSLRDADQPEEQPSIVVEAKATDTDERAELLARLEIMSL
jgi:phage head maturation protease